MDENVVAYLKFDDPGWVAHDLGQAVDFIVWVRPSDGWEGRDGGAIRAHFAIAEVTAREIRVIGSDAPPVDWEVHRRGEGDPLEGTRSLADAEILAWGDVRSDGIVDVCFDTDDGAHHADWQSLANIGAALARAHDLCLDRMEATGADVSEGRRHASASMTSKLTRAFDAILAKDLTEDEGRRLLAFLESLRDRPPEGPFVGSLIFHTHATAAALAAR